MYKPVKDFLKNNHGAVLVCAFLILFITWGSCARAATQFEVGPTQIASNFHTGWMLTLTERIQGRYDFTLGYITEQDFKSCDRPDCQWTIREQLFFGVELLVTAPFSDRLRLGIGPYHFQNADRVGTSKFRAGLSLEYRFTDRLGIRARHFSTAGSGPNIEQCNAVVCLTNDWNTGQDSYARLVWYF